MTYLIRPGDPRPNTQDQFLSEQVEMVFADGITPVQHESDVNDFLISLREDINHTASIRSIDLQIEDIKGNGKLTGITTIHYLLIGTEDLPYLP